MDDIKFSDRLRYAVDNTFSRGTIALIAWLGVLSLVVILVAAALVTITGANLADAEGRLPFLEAFWLSLMRTMDAGTMGGDTGWGFRIIMFGVTLGGVFVISTLIGVLTSGVEGKLDELRKGRSRVIESGHTVILGWSEQIFTIISELAAANENQSRPCIVILGSHDKVEMEEEIRNKANTGKTRIVCRSGSPMEMEELRIVSLNSAKSMIVLLTDSDNADADVIKTVLAITNYPGRRKEPYHIVAELRDPKNDEIARVVGKDEVEWVQVGNLVARVIAQTCRQSGLSVVYTELLDFGGDEIYFTQQKALEGKTYGEALKHFEKNTVMGILPAAGKVAALNPPMDTQLRPGDQLVVIAEDDDKIVFNPSPPSAQEEAIIDTAPPSPAPEQTLILGWNWRGATILNELDNYVAPGSEALIVADHEEVKNEVRKCARTLKNQKVSLQEGDTTDRTTLEELDLKRFDHIILLSYSDVLPTQQADAHTLITLLHLRDISDRSGVDFSIVSEMLDVRNRNLAEVTRADDFIVSDKLVSLMLAQISENKNLNAVFRDMFDPEGSEIYLKPAAAYIKTGQPVNFYTLLEAARRRGETAIGYRLKRYGHDAEKSYGVTLNPAKSEPVTFSNDDHIVVLAND